MRARNWICKIGRHDWFGKRGTVEAWIRRSFRFELKLYSWNVVELTSHSLSPTDCLKMKEHVNLSIWMSSSRQRLPVNKLMSEWYISVIGLWGVTVLRERKTGKYDHIQSKFSTAKVKKTTTDHALSSLCYSLSRFRVLYCSSCSITVTLPMVAGWGSIDTTSYEGQLRLHIWCKSF